MSTNLSPENETFIEASVGSGEFHSREHLLDQAVTLLRQRHDLLQRIDEGTAQLRAGRGIEIGSDEELRALLHRIAAKGMQRLGLQGSP